MTSVFETLTAVQDGGETVLQRPIDNRTGELCVALRALSYTVGWYNLKSAAYFSWAPVGQGTGVLNIDPGLYSATELIALLTNTEAGTVYGMTMAISSTTGLFTMTTTNMEVSASDSIWTLLGLDAGLGGVWIGGDHTGDRPVDFTGVGRIHVHLDQLNTHQNAVDGAQSTLLDLVVPSATAFGSIVEVFRPLPLWKRLQDGTISTLRLRLLDSTGSLIDMHGLRATAVLEFRRTIE